jgi:hypothetical protein
MRIEDCEELIQMGAEELSETLLGTAYYNLVKELQVCVRVWAIESIAPRRRRRRCGPWDPSFVSVPHH